MEQSLTEIIQNNYGVIKNPYQGTDKKVLFVCSAGILRSATAARIYANQFNTRCAGTYGIALIPLNQNLIAWADEIVFVNKENHTMFLESALYLKELDDKIIILNIPDVYEHMHPELIKEFGKQYKSTINYG